MPSSATDRAAPTRGRGASSCRDAGRRELRPVDPHVGPGRPALVLALALACGDPGGSGSTTEDASTTASAATGASTTDASTGAPTTGEPASCQQTGTLSLSTPATFTLPPGATCEAPWTLAEPRVVAVLAPGARLSLADELEAEPGWLAPHLRGPGPQALTLENPGPDELTAEVSLLDYGPAPPSVLHERSLAWTQPEILDAPEMCRLGCLMAKISEDGHGGRLLRAWMDRFATTAHSERLGPKQLLDEFAAQQGTPPEQWDLDLLPFTLTGAHNRIDLRRDGHCGELRVSLASTHPIFRPFHLIFLVRQAAAPADRSPAGVSHCAAAAHRGAALSLLEGPALHAAVLAELAAGLQGSAFLAAETVEFTVSPWEWRQWFPGPSPAPEPGLTLVLDNPPLFQTLDIPRLNTAGPDRDAFLAWVADNAAALDARQLEIPEPFRAPSARVSQGVPWTPLDLDGLDPGLLQQFPQLRQHLEIVGCPACHTADAEFVQTLPSRTFSPFYDKELDARAEHLAAMARGDAPQPPFGPLQPGPVLHP